ncbi:MAG: 4Fe-4S binding protein [Anaerolineae bacterium]
MARPLWFVKLVKMSFPGRFLLARMTHVSLFGKLIDRWLFQDDAIVYLPQDRVLQINASVERAKEVVLPSQVLEHFIEKANYHWIMNTCICRDSSQCQDYPIDLGCLFLGEAAMGINPKLGRRVTREEALEHVERCREAGLVHLVGRNKLDTIWLGIGPGHKLLTICHCCPCCCLWRVLPDIVPWIGDKVTRMAGVTVSVTERCVGCGTCTQGVCFVDAIHLSGERAVIGDACRGCGRCVSVCPQEAIELVIDDAEFIPKTVNRIAPLVDVV